MPTNTVIYLSAGGVFAVLLWLGTGSKKDNEAVAVAEGPSTTRVTGIVNLGNTCFANVVLQVCYFDN